MNQQYPTPLIVGRGRVASQWCRYLAALDRPFRSWNRHQSRGKLEAALGDSDFVLFLIRDVPMPGLVADWRSDGLLDGKSLAHFSGAVEIDGVEAFHPLHAFPADRDMSIEELAHVPFAQVRGRALLEDFFPGLENPRFQIEPGRWRSYHALACVMANPVQALWQAAIRAGGKEFGLETAHWAPFLRSTVESFLHDPANALTGPVSRADWSVWEEQLVLLDALDEPLLGRVYELLGRTLREETTR